MRSWLPICATTRRPANSYRTVITHALSRPWAISPSMLNSILQAVNQRGIQIMRRQFKFHQLSVLALLLLLALTNFSISTAQDNAKSEKTPSEGMPVMWREPSDIATRDLFLGSGGEM